VATMPPASVLVMVTLCALRRRLAAGLKPVN
jgi:hypothetical protein